MAPSKKKTTTNADGDLNLTKPATLAYAVLPVKINADPAEEEVFTSPQGLYKIMKCRDSRGVPDLDVLNNSKKV
jgi:hypothetical protein